MTEKSTALMKVEEIESKFPALIAGQSKALQIMQEVLEDDDINIFSLTKICIAPGGINQFIIKYASGREETVSEVIGVILLRRKMRGMWLDGTLLGTPPSCSSSNAKVGTGDIDGSGKIETRYCKVCPMAQFGSAVKDGVKGEGQMCQLRNVLFFLREKKSMPDILSAPPTSAGIVQGFLTELSGDALYPHQAIVKTTLAKFVNKNNKPYSKIQFSDVVALNEKQKVGADALHKAIKSLFGEKRIDDEDIGAIIDDESPTGKPVDTE